jgi:hypothetical protein
MEHIPMTTAARRIGAIVGVSVVSLGLVVGTGIASSAATVGITNAVHQSLSVHHTPGTTPKPTSTRIPAGHDANDDNGRDATEHPTPEPGDDDAPGTPDRHGGRLGGDDNDGHEQHGPQRGSGSGSGHHDDNGGSHR